jgi:large subunit ribosomal protein L15
MQLHQLKPKTAFAVSKRVGRGGKRGKTSGRGTKGQKARAGHRIRPEARDLIKKIPKLRGHGKNRARTVSDAIQKPVTLNVSSIDSHFENGERVTPATLREKGIVRSHAGTRPAIKILGDGNLSKKVSVADCAVSKSAREKIEKAGGSVAVSEVDTQ